MQSVPCSLALKMNETKQVIKENKGRHLKSTLSPNAILQFISIADGFVRKKKTPCACSSKDGKLPTELRFVARL